MPVIEGDMTRAFLPLACLTYFSFNLPLVNSQCAQVPDTNSCHFITGASLPLLPPNCTIAKCSQEPKVRVTDPKKGKVSFTLAALPAECNVTRYEIALRVSSSSADCATPDGDWKTHSRREVYVSYCSPDDVYCGKTRKCNAEHVVNFNYVFTGWYQLKITPHLGSSTRQAQKTKPVKLETNYDAQGLVDLNSTVSSLQYRDDNNESRVSFLFSPDLDWGDEDRFHVTLKLVSRVESGADACYSSGEEHSCCSFHPVGANGTIRTDGYECIPYSRGGGQPNCSATRNSVQCQFQNMTPGAYCAILSFLDDRCEPDTLWTEPDNRPCQWQTYKEFRSEQTPSSQHSAVVDSSPNTVFIVMGVIIGFVMIVAFLFFAMRYRSKRGQRLPSQLIEERPHHRYNLDQLAPRPFSFSNQFTLTGRPRPEVLILYCRDSKEFIDLVVTLRNVLNNICKCQVYDYYDESLWNDVSIDPEGWVRELVVEREAKLVIVASRGLAINNRSEVANSSNPHPFDHLFSFVLKLIRDLPDEDSYKRHFVVTFDGYSDGNHMVEHLNPYTRFVLPKHLNKLFEHLHDSQTTVHFDTSRKLEERDEVRNLRMRLEKLINRNLSKLV